MTLQEEKILIFLRNISKQLDWHEYTDLKPWLIDYIKTMPIALRIDKRFPRFKEGFYRSPNELYRACENTTIIPTRSTMALPWSTVERISHAPLDKQHLYIKNFGRCNLPGEARFYCSNYYPTACVECLTNGFTNDRSEDKTVTLGAWTVNQPLVLAQVAFSKNKLKEISHFAPAFYADKIKFSESWYEHTFKELENDSSRTCSIDYAMEIIEFFSDEFGKMQISSDRDYSLSIFFTDYIFNQIFSDDPKTIDGIIYPSVKYSYQEFNIVIHPRAMSKISFANAAQVWVTFDKSSKSLQCTPLETSFSDPTGNLKWNMFKS